MDTFCKKLEPHKDRWDMKGTENNPLRIALVNGHSTDQTSLPIAYAITHSGLKVSFSPLKGEPVKNRHENVEAGKRYLYAMEKVQYLLGQLEFEYDLEPDIQLHLTVNLDRTVTPNRIFVEDGENLYPVLTVDDDWVMTVTLLHIEYQVCKRVILLEGADKHYKKPLLNLYRWYKMSAKAEDEISSVRDIFSN